MSTTREPGRVRTEPRLTKPGLERSALWHLQRRAMTESELRTALQRKVKRAEAAHGITPDAAVWVDALLLKLKDSLLIDDNRVARARADSDVARGRSRRRVAQRLRHKGVSAELVADVTADIDDDRAADHFVRRRRLTGKDRQKALTALARQGFSFDVARRALERATTDG